MNHGLPDSVIQRMQAVFACHPAVEKAVLYGSRAKGCHRPGSDIDLTLCGGSLDDAALSRIADELDDLDLPYRIDLSLLHQQTHPSLLDHIRRVGVALYERGGAGV
jgi:predicted nucleotidyltransferase